MPARLQPVSSCAISLRYALDGLPGAMRSAYLAEELLPTLGTAQRFLRRHGCEILLWDAYRTKTTQQHIFDSYWHRLHRDKPSLGAEELHSLTCAFVSDPASCFPHGTGGAVDVTLIHNGQEVDMGSDFDDFTDRGTSDYFLRNLPRRERDRRAAHFRALLIEAMVRAGFAGLASEWWHYEWGTARWASEVGATPTLVQLLDPPPERDRGLADPPRRRAWPAMVSGVACIFDTVEGRRDALAGRVAGDYYARSTTLSTRELAAAVCDMFAMPAAHLVQSGLAAYSCAARSLIPPGGVALVDEASYYECKASLLEYGLASGTKILTADLRRPVSITQALSGVDHLDAILGDHPANWFLHSLPITELRNLANARGAKLIIDASVQPLQPDLAKAVDLMVLSLSKAPSNGYVQGGAILGDPRLVAGATRTAAIDGHVLDSRAAHAIHQQLPELPDRLLAQSRKAQYLKRLLERHPLVQAVRVADPALHGGLSGGVLVIELRESAHGDELERLVAFNNESSVLTLPRLVCTFGGAISTIEHFHSTPRHRDGVATDRVATGEALIPPNFVRVSAGADRAEDLGNSLWLLFNLIARRGAYEQRSSIHQKEAARPLAVARVRCLS